VVKRSVDRFDSFNIWRDNSSMRLSKTTIVAPLCGLFAVLGGTVAVVAGGDEVEFNRDIRPILAENCFACHGPDKNAREADLRLDSEKTAFKKLDDDTRTLVPGNAAKSVLYQRITSTDPDARMPPAESGKKLTKQQIELIGRWIKQGAKWQGHWAFIPPRRADPPRVKQTNWIRNKIDRFILAKLEGYGLQPSAAADRVTLIRRVSFDLTGLPPSVVAVDAFLDDHSEQAYEKVVDRLLASKHYGERMAVHWLDLVRYADSGGYHSDNEHHISPYRDYVIHAFNDNMPFDRFTREQLAGDLLPNPTTEQIIATGYNRLNKTTEEGGAQPGEYLEKYAADRVRTTAGTWMGATLGCAECHDHKYDPYTTKDFYSFAAFFADIKEIGKYGGGGRRDPELLVPSREQAMQLAQLEKQIAHKTAALSKLGEKHESEAIENLKSQIQSLETQKNAIQKQFTRTLITVAVAPREMRILPRGNWLDRTGQIVTPAIPDFLQMKQVEARRLNRLDLANWFVSRNNPLTARVFVNRLWKMFFAAGLSKVLDDVGAQGEWPTHPELLDWLAIEFIDSGWDVKHTIKLLVTSNTYRQSSLTNKRLTEFDPMNRLYARQSRWRLDAEMIRDNALSVSGLLVRKIGGRSVKPYQPTGYWKHLNFPQRKWKNDTDENQYRRALYTHWQRTFLHPSLLAFDAPSREECTAERPVSNTPKAALTLLNDPTYVEAARVLAVRIIQSADNTNGRIRWAWRQVLSRNPNKREIGVLTRLLRENLEHYNSQPEAAKAMLTNGIAASPKDIEPVQVAAWTAVARAILNLNETITRN